MATGFVYLVGSGPGDPGLLTLRAREVLEGATAVVYDNLVHPQILDWAPASAERVRMGKVGHLHGFSQDEITQALIDRAKQGAVVVRLKGGDPSVFGRLGEEAVALARAGIPFEIVPGVTAASGAAAYAGIPLTHRDYAPSVTLVTGHRRTDGGDGPEIDWQALARASGTLAIYMGVKHLGEAASQLMAAGRGPETPVALVRRATWPDQEVLTGTLGDIAERARKQNFRPPAVAIVGQVVELRKELSWFERKPLRGKKILITRALHQTAEANRSVQSRGGIPVALPLIELQPCGHKSGVESALRRVFAFDWVVFSSVNAVRFTFEKMDEMGLDARTFGAARVCAVGPKTAAELAARGIRADVVPDEYVAEALVGALTAVAELRGTSVLIPRAKVAREVVPRALESRGARVEVLPLYENVRPAAYPEEALHTLVAGKLDLVTLASSSAAKNYAT
ncbi:MAG TPA: uroporphyrinogen-III C-methyltransferase, partial [Deferrisomatales bacterium]|nr:uroporphyrinogen-III C-methyltransferase [Deferrisomatales bacterium]